MPAVVNRSVGSLGTSGDDGTTLWPRAAKKSRNERRSSAAVLRLDDVGDADIHAPRQGNTGTGTDRRRCWNPRLRNVAETGTACRAADAGGRGGRFQISLRAPPLPESRALAGSRRRRSRDARAGRRDAGVARAGRVARGGE